MLTFKEFRKQILEEKDEKLGGESDFDNGVLEESLNRSGSPATLVARSQKAGSDAVRHFASARNILLQKDGEEGDAYHWERLERTLDQMLVGLILRRDQDDLAQAAQMAALRIDKTLGGQGAKKR